MTVRPEGPTAPEYLPPGWSNQLDSGNRGQGQKMHLACHQFDYTCGIAAALFAASVDVTDAVSNCERNYSVRSHWNRIWRQAAVSRLSDQRFDRWYKSGQGHALCVVSAGAIAGADAINTSLTARAPVFNLTARRDHVLPTRCIKLMPG